MKIALIILACLLAYPLFVFLSTVLVSVKEWLSTPHVKKSDRFPYNLK